MVREAAIERGFDWLETAACPARGLSSDCVSTNRRRHALGRKRACIVQKVDCGNGERYFSLSPDTHGKRGLRMDIDVYITVADQRPCWGEAKLITRSGLAVLPPHPDGKAWLFFVSTTSDDELLADRPFDVIAALNGQDYFFL